MSLPLGEYWRNVKKGDLEMAADGTVYRRTRNGNLVRVTKVPRRVTREEVRERERAAREKRVQAAMKSAEAKHLERAKKVWRARETRAEEARKRVRRFALAVVVLAALPWAIWLVS